LENPGYGLFFYGEVTTWILQIRWFCVELLKYLNKYKNIDRQYLSKIIKMIADFLTIAFLIGFVKFRLYDFPQVWYLFIQNVHLNGKRKYHYDTTIDNNKHLPIPRIIRYPIYSALIAIVLISCLWSFYMAKRFIALMKHFVK